MLHNTIHTFQYFILGRPAAKLVPKPSCKQKQGTEEKQSTKTVEWDFEMRMRPNSGYFHLIQQTEDSHSQVKVLLMKFMHNTNNLFCKRECYGIGTERCIHEPPRAHSTFRPTKNSQYQNIHNAGDDHSQSSKLQTESRSHQRTHDRLLEKGTRWAWGVHAAWFRKERLDFNNCCFQNLNARRECMYPNSFHISSHQKLTTTRILTQCRRWSLTINYIANWVSTASMNSQPNRLYSKKGRHETDSSRTPENICRKLIQFPISPIH